MIMTIISLIHIQCSKSSGDGGGGGGGGVEMCERYNIIYARLFAH